MSLGSGAAVVAAAAAGGAVAEPLAAVLAAAVLVLVALALRFRRTETTARSRPGPAVPPTWSVALAAPAVLGTALVELLGPVPGLVTLAVLLVVFLVLAGDILA